MIEPAWIGLLSLVAVAIITGLFALNARRGGTKLSPAATYNEMWSRLDKQDARLAMVENSLRTVGDGFDALYTAVDRNGVDIKYTLHERVAIDTARRLRTGGPEPVILR